MATTLLVRARAWTGGSVERVRVLVSDGEVRVWDPVAGFYTVCHALSPAAVRRILRLAEGQVREPRVRRTPACDETAHFRCV